MKIEDLIINETNDWIALSKPSGLLSIPDREGKEISLKSLLKEKYEEIFTVHRLDKDTSGIIIFAKNEATHKLLSAQFEQRETNKIYLGLVAGCPEKKEGTVDLPIAEHPAKNGTMIIQRKARPDDRVGRGKEAITDYTVLEDFGIYSLVQFRIHTGRTHQIRVHMKDIGHPIVCDTLYGDGKPVFVSSLKSKFKLSKSAEEEKPLLHRLALHAFRLSFTNNDGALTELESPLHKDMRATLQQLQKRKKGK